MRRSAVVGFVLAGFFFATPVSAVTMAVPSSGAPPIQILNGQTVDVDIELDTTDGVGGVNIEFFESAGLTINSCTDLGGAANMFCSAISGGFVADALDVAGIGDGTPW
jgi:hypothetical protein